MNLHMQIKTKLIPLNKLHMSEKINIDPGNVQITLLLPLWGRAAETLKRKSLLIDKTASEIINKIDYDFNKLAKNIRVITQFEWIVHSIHYGM